MRRPIKGLAGQVMIITGASSGIGAATAIECARAGMDVVINARREEKLRAVADRVRAVGGGRPAEIVAGDVAEPGMSERMLDAAERAFGRFDAVFANAGYGFEAPMHEVSEADLRAIFDVNFFAGVDLLQKAAQRLIAAHRPGHLFMCSSCLAKFTMPKSGPYCATKAAQNHVCRAMRMELKPYRINVASVHPIGTRTEFMEASAKRSGKLSDPATIAAQTPSMFMQPPERVARAVLRCMRHPKPEVWTSFGVRLFAAIALLCPRVADAMMVQADRTLAKRAQSR